MPLKFNLPHVGEIVNDILHHPSRDAKIRDKSLPWINTSIRKEMNKRYKLLKDEILSGDPEKWRLYKEKRNSKKQLKWAVAAYKTFTSG